MRNKATTATLIVLTFCSPLSVVAGENFGYTATVDLAPTVTQSATFTTVDELRAGLETAGLEQKFPGYDGTQRAFAKVNYMLLPMEAAFPNVGYTGNGARLRYQVPSIGIDEVFQGANRDESIDQLVEYLKRNSGRIFEKLAEVSPSSPIAGNPNSLMSRMAAGAFNTAFTPFASNKTAPEEGETTPGLVGVGLGFGSYSGSGISTRAYTIPLSYTYRSPLDPRRQLSINAPVTVSDIEGAYSYTGDLGVSYRFPVNDFWALTPNVNYGAVYSGDLGSAGQILSAALTSALYFDLDVVELTIGNMAGYYATLNVPFGDYEGNPDIRNWVFRNGAMVSRQVSLAGTKTLDFYFIDTRFTGSDLYDQYTDEVGLAIGTNRSASSSRSYFRGSVGYLFGQQSHGWSINIGYWF
jgi:hypothetical protein